MYTNLMLKVPLGYNPNFLSSKFLLSNWIYTKEYRIQVPVSYVKTWDEQIVITDTKVPISKFYTFMIQINISGNLGNVSFF